MPDTLPAFLGLFAAYSGPFLLQIQASEPPLTPSNHTVSSIGSTGMRYVTSSFKHHGFQTIHTPIIIVTSAPWFQAEVKFRIVQAISTGWSSSKITRMAVVTILTVRAMRLLTARINKSKVVSMGTTLCGYKNRRSCKLP